VKAAAPAVAARRASSLQGRSPLRLLLIATLAGAAWVTGSALPRTASASVPACDPASASPCQVTVPLDRSGSFPGTVDLYVERIRPIGASRGAVLALAGGPGQSATAFSDDLAFVLAPVLAHRELVVLDQRGTGQSGALRCPSLERSHIGRLDAAARLCADRLGPGRAFYTTLDSVEDIEAVRRALGLERVSIYAVSYGTRVALAYAARHPERVDRMVLDSAVPLGGPDPFLRPTVKAVPRVLRALCRGECQRITHDPVADLAALTARLRRGRLRARVVESNGRRRNASFGNRELLDVLLAGDLDPSLRAPLPAAVVSALRGDATALLRLYRRAADTEAKLDETSPNVFSPALNAATICDEVPLPWDRTKPTRGRWREALARLSAIPERRFAPLDRQTVLANDVLELCRRWPASALLPPPPDAGPLHALPVLIVEGENDLLTPVEGLRDLVRRLPRAVELTVPSAGHNVLATDASGCAESGLSRFFSGRRVNPSCPRVARAFPATSACALRRQRLLECPSVSGTSRQECLNRAVIRR
jgi:pimeloyl-ACP methyl ester carboxylesterase